MSDKEERIRVEIIGVCKRPKNKDQYKCDCIESPNEMAGLQVCPIHPQVVAKQGISKQGAIEVMAKALCHRHCPEKVCTSCDEWEKYGTKEDAEAALNALLGRRKK